MELERFRGVVAPIVTPCDEGEAIDWPRLERVLEELLTAPITGLYINGGTGDGGKLTVAERRATAEHLVPRLRRAGQLSIVHVGQTTPREAEALAEHAMGQGADAVSSIPPRASWRETMDYYRALCATGAPVLVYYIPGVTGTAASPEQLKELMSLPGVIGIKVSDFNVFLIRQLKGWFPDKLVYTGLDEMLVPGLLYGADGTIGTWINLLPGFYCKAWQLAGEGNAQALYRMQQAYTDFLRLGWEFGILDAFQELMYSRDMALRCFRRPSAWVPGSMPEGLREEMLAGLERLAELGRTL